MIKPMAIAKQLVVFSGLLAACGCQSSGGKGLQLPWSSATKSSSAASRPLDAKAARQPMESRIDELPPPANRMGAT